MIRALVVYAHPNPDSFNAAVRDAVLERLAAAGAEVRHSDLYARGFDPVMSRIERAGYHDVPVNRDAAPQDVADLFWADTLIFVYPTWWYGPPAILKGWLDRVLMPDVAFLMPTEDRPKIAPALHHIARLGVFTTCGASFWLTSLMGAPGRRMLVSGVGWLCSPQRRTVFAAHYRMDSSTPESRARHLAVVRGKVDRLLAGGHATAARREATA